ncbi:MAG: Uma2 family endonuclease [Solirubrobacteraceae bacterium]
MRTLVSDPPPPEFEELLELRRRWGADRRDEVWEGVLHMNSAPDLSHGDLVMQLGAALLPGAKAAALRVSDQFNLGQGLSDYRIPDVGLHCERSGAWLDTAALAAEILSPGDESWDKLPFFAAHQVDEVLILDPAERTVHWLALDERGEYQPIERSGLIDLGPAQLAEQLDWP